MFLSRLHQVGKGILLSQRVMEHRNFFSVLHTRKLRERVIEDVMTTNLASGNEIFILLCLCARRTSLFASAFHRNTMTNTWLQTSRHGCTQCIHGEY